MPLSKYVVDNRRFTAHDDHYVRVKFQLQCIFYLSHVDFPLDFCPNDSLSYYIFLWLGSLKIKLHFWCIYIYIVLFEVCSVLSKYLNTKK